MTIFRGTHLFFGVSMLCAAATIRADYPLIRAGSLNRDPLYRQQQQDVEQWYSAAGEAPILTLYRYRSSSSDDLFTVAAAFNLPYDTVATLNGWDSPALFNPETEILLPNQPGLFIPLNPVDSWEKNLAGSHQLDDMMQVRITTQDQKTRAFYFLPGEKFTSQERRRFLTELFIPPLPAAHVTSPYGYRLHPITGTRSFHTGVDLAAPSGTGIMAAAQGTVWTTGHLNYFGLYVILEHAGQYRTLYAHLQSILVQGGQTVEQGQIIARSGNSGISTGPHLHFEIRRHGKPINPARFVSFGSP